VSTLAAVIEREFDEPWYRDDLAALVGHRSPAELAAWIEQIYRERLGRTPAIARFASKSFGAVFGFDDVVLKLFPSSLSERMLRASERCLAAVVARGYPAPAQLVPTFVRRRHLGCVLRARRRRDRRCGSPDAGRSTRRARARHRWARCNRSADPVDSDCRAVAAAASHQLRSRTRGRRMDRRTRRGGAAHDSRG
jgi:hypothetical protein